MNNHNNNIYPNFYFAASTSPGGGGHHQASTDTPSSQSNNNSSVRITHDQAFPLLTPEDEAVLAALRHSGWANTAGGVQQQFVPANLSQENPYSAAHVPCAGTHTTGHFHPSTSTSTTAAASLHSSGHPHCPPTSDDISQIPVLRARVRQHVQRVVECLPLEQTRAYREAMGKDALLVQTESDPMQFVRYCGYDVYAGAQRLCCYWTERLKLFGPERAFLPLVLTGTGALSPDDLLPLRAGFPALLPSILETGQSCVFFDRRNLVPTVTTENKLRAFFYIFKILAENDLSQIDGAVVLAATATPRSKGEHEVDWDSVRRSITLASNCFPVKTITHLISFPQHKKPALATKIVNSFVATLQQYFFFAGGGSSSFSTNQNRGLRFHVHVQTPDEEANKVLNELIARGFTKEGIPHVFGGEWQLPSFFYWCQERMESEQEIYKGRLLDKSTAGVVGKLSWNQALKGLVKNHDPDPCSTTSVPTVAVPALAGVVDDSNEVPNTSSTCTKSKRSGRSRRGFPKTGDSSPPLPAAALSEEERIAKRRMEDLIRSRRKRERERLEIEELQKNSAALLDKNAMLSAEQNCLSRLLSEAEQCVAQLSASSQQQGYGGFV
ncbi:hypothetical protein ACA910_002151 [Epithemia clementina (nom. ined.)]